MNNNIIGNPNSKGKTITIVAGNYNKKIVEQLIDGASDAFYHFGGNKKDLKIIIVSGAFEIAGAVNQVLKNTQSDAIVTLGAVIRGGTPHFGYIADAASKEISNLSRTNDIPIIFGVLTTNDLQQAQERAGTKAGNKGWEVMETALRTISVYEQIKSTA